MATSGGGEETLLSPKDRVKFLCSHGGKILPRPPDGQLKYVGGETRVIAVPRDINFSELMKKVTTTLPNGDMVLKYQLIPEDLETLVSVTCEEELQYMLAECDRHEEKLPENGGNPRLRAFLFPSNPIILEHSQIAPNIIMGNHALLQTYIDAINGVIRNPSSTIKRTTSNVGRPSPDKYIIASNINQDGYHNSRAKEIPRVSSSPSLYNLGQSNTNHHHHHHHHQQPYYQSSRLHGPPQLKSALSMERGDIGRYNVGHTCSCHQYYSSASRPNRGSSSGCEQCGDQSSGGVEMVDGLLQSPVKRTWR